MRDEDGAHLGFTNFKAQTDEDFGDSEMLLSLDSGKAIPTIPRTGGLRFREFYWHPAKACLNERNAT